MSEKKQYMTKAAPTSSEPGQSNPNQKNDLDRLRILRTEIVDLQKRLLKISTGDDKLEGIAEYIKKNMADIKNIMDEVKETQFPKYPDAIRHIINLWEDMKICPLLANPDGKIELKDQICYLKTLGTIFKDMTYNIGYLTIPDRVQEWINDTRTGYYIPFHDVFEDEMPDAADRTKLLKFMSWSPKAIDGGLVEPETGLIYKYHKEKPKRMLNYLYIVIAVLVSVGIVIGSAYIKFKGWPISSDNLTVLWTGWLAVTGGVIVHLGINTAKRIQTQNSHPPIMAMNQIPILLDAKFAQVLLKLLLILVGFFGLIFALGIGKFNLLNAFLVGYSLDSVVDLFSNSIEQRANVQLTTLKKQLGVTD